MNLVHLFKSFVPKRVIFYQQEIISNLNKTLVLLKIVKKYKNVNFTIYLMKIFFFKNFIPDFGNLPQHNIIDTNEKKLLLHQVICEHLYRSGHIDVSDCLIKVSK